MSNKAITWAYQQELKAGPKFVLVVLADLADNEGSCYPGIDTLGEMTGMSRTAVKTNLDKLRDEHLITEERRHRKDGSRTSNRYWLQMKGTISLEPESDPSTSDDKGRNPDNLGSESDDPRAGIRPPILEPLVNPQTEPTDENSLIAPEAIERTIDKHFDAFWKIWPRHDAKAVARKKFALAAKKLPLGDLVDAAGAWLAARPGIDPQFVPHAATWLNQERWNDESPPGGGRPLTPVERNLLDYQARYGGSDGPATDTPALDPGVSDRWPHGY